MAKIKSNTWYKILLLIFAVCLSVSIILSFVPIGEICGEATSSCSIVQHSEYESVLGINNSYFGIIAFSSLIFILISQMISPRRYKERFLSLGTMVAAVAAVYFISLQLFVIKAICPYCMVIDTLSIIAFGIVVARKNSWN